MDHTQAIQKLLNQIDQLKSQIRDLKDQNQDYLRKNRLSVENTYSIIEWVRHLRFIYSVEDIINRKNGLNYRLDKFLEEILFVWQQSQDTSLRIRHNDLARQTSGFIETEWYRKSNIKVYGEVTGSVEVYYKDRTLQIEESHCPVDKKNLIDYIAKRIGSLIEKNQAETHIAQLADQYISYQEAERRRLSREIHDELGQLLTGMQMEIYSLQNKLDDPQADRPTDFCRLVKIVKKAQQCVHTIGSSGNTRMLDEHGLSNAIRVISEELFSPTDIVLNMSIDIDEEVLNQETKLSLFRIVQESMTNIIRHAKANIVDIHCSIQAGEVILQVLDNGVGIKPSKDAPYKGLGILGMRERTRLLNGDFSVESTVGRGTEIRVKIPIT